MRCGTCNSLHVLQVFRRKPHFPPPFLCAPAFLGAMMVFATRCWAELGAGRCCCCCDRVAHCSQLVRTTAPPPAFACRRALCTTRVRRARLAGQQGAAGGAAGCCSATGVLFPRAGDAWTREDRRAHTHAPSLSRLHVPASSEMWATKHAACAGALATTQTAGWTSAWRGWRSPVDVALSMIIGRFMERRRRACAFDSRWCQEAQELTKRHRPPQVYSSLCRAAAGSLQ